MRTVKFAKYQGLGNSFLITERHDYLRQGSRLAKLACSKDYGIGADGMMLVLGNRTEADFDFQMKLYNANGSEAEMSGNGIRCFMHYLINNGLVEGPTARILTDAGILDVTALNAEMLILEHEYLDLMEFRVLMGSATLDKFPLSDEVYSIVSPYLNSILGIWKVDIGNPHLVIYHQQSEEINHLELFNQLNRLFHSRINIEIIKRVDDKEIDMVVYERGVGLTSACGTGSVASAVCYGTLYDVNGTIVVNNPGGKLKVDFVELAENEYLGYLTGPSQFVANIEMSPEGI